MNCYVCKNPIRAGGVYLGNDAQGREVWRHRSKCAPLSKQWCRAFPRSMSAKLMRAVRKKLRGVERPGQQRRRKLRVPVADAVVHPCFTSTTTPAGFVAQREAATP
jgi:hypothetical protein